MIVHKIEKHRTAKISYFPSFTPPVHPWSMGKLEYAIYLRNLQYGVGDWVVSRHVGYPILLREVYKVVNIDELHRFVTFGHPDIGPLCLTLENAWGQPMEGKYGATLYRLIENDELPPELIGK